MFRIFFRHRPATHAALLWQALLIVLAVGQLACDGAVVTPNPVQPTRVQATPTSEWTTLGYFTMTVTAAPSCSLPDYAMKASYGGVLLRQSGRQLSVLFDPYGPIWGTIWGTIDGQNVSLTIVEEGGPYGEDFIALIDGSEIAYGGTAVGTMDASRITATFNGTVRVSRQSDHSVIATCVASDHLLEMVK